MKTIAPVQFQIFQDIPNLKHAFSTRSGGVSLPPYDSLNLGLRTGDRASDVLRNREMFYRHLNIDPQALVYPEQTHSAHIVKVSKPGIIGDCDALISNQKNLFLSIQTADCFPVFLFDPVNQALGLVHSGWRGASQNITGLTIHKMQFECNADPQKIRAAIGPGVLQQNYQVDTPVARHFADLYLKPDGPGHYKLDLRQVIVDQLISAGIIPDQIEQTSVCSFEEKDLFYSYRRDGKRSGRMMGILGLTD